MRISLKVCLALFVMLAISTTKAQTTYNGAVSQTTALLYDEARAVYLVNLTRRANGVPPLRWNQQLTDAARWFSWDSVENRPEGFCGHQDSLGTWPVDRADRFGYLGNAGAENAFCGYLSPAAAVQGWMDSDGHRANILDPNSRETGLGYYRRASDGRGYVTQDFGNDPAYAPVIIENEAITTTQQAVGLYIYDRAQNGGFAGMAAADQMMVSNDPCFTSAAWEPYTAEKSWTLASGEGWRPVYVQTSDGFSRTMTVSDTIYLGSDFDLSELADHQTSSTQPQVRLYNLDGGTFHQVQFSLGWLADDSYPTFTKWWGNGSQIGDAAAWGGTAYRLSPGSGESFAWVYDTTFIQNTPMTAYFRLKSSANTSTGEVARIAIQGGNSEYGPVSLAGTDFNAPNQYQEFALDFNFQPVSGSEFLIFKFWRSGNADIDVDAVSIFSAPQSLVSPLTWQVPGENYRGQGVWVRYTNGSQFSPLRAGVTQQPVLAVAPTSLAFTAVQNGGLPPALQVDVAPKCTPFNWQASSDAAWLTTQAAADSLTVTADPASLSAGTYTATITISPQAGVDAEIVLIPVVLDISASNQIYLPLIGR